MDFFPFLNCSPSNVFFVSGVVRQYLGLWRNKVLRVKFIDGEVELNKRSKPRGKFCSFVYIVHLFFGFKESFQLFHLSDLFREVCQ